MKNDCADYDPYMNYDPDYGYKCGDCHPVNIARDWVINGYGVAKDGFLLLIFGPKIPCKILPKVFDMPKPDALKCVNLWNTTAPSIGSILFFYNHPYKHGKLKKVYKTKCKMSYVSNTKMVR